MLTEVILLLAGLGILAKASDFTIVNAVRFSRTSGINEMAIGFVLIAVSTSLPEMSIGIISSLDGSGALSLGNIIGANIANMTLVLGILAVLGLKIDRGDTENIAHGFILVAVVAVMLLILGRTDLTVGVFLLIVFYTFSKTLLDKGIKIEHPTSTKREMSKYAALTVVGIFVVLLSARMVTEYSLVIASGFMLSETLIGATILSIGTTLPELSVGVAALRRKNIDLAIGDSVGSVVANITLILGVASVINPIIVDNVAFAAIVFLLFVSGVFVFLSNRLQFDRKRGFMLIILYFFYLMMIIKV